MDNSLKRLLGMGDEGKRVYRFVSGEVSKEDFENCQMLDVLLFGSGGYVETLGPTWSLVSDPRFTAVEDAFIVNRRAVLGGDATSGKQYISSDGSFSSTIADLDEYSTILGEGRYFYTVLTHPDKDCVLRNWYLRIFPEVLEKEGITAPPQSSDIVCTCYNEGSARDPRTFKDEEEDVLWAFIRQECPNYFTQEGKPNGVAQRLFDLFRADLLGLIADYAVTPISDVYVSLDTGDVLNQQEQEVLGSTPHVFLEVDILEKALTQRAVLRATAAKILRQIGFAKTLKEELGYDFILTDWERDQVLRLVYNPPSIAGIQVDPGTNWHGFLYVIKEEVLKYLKGIKATGKTSEEREKDQLLNASMNAHETFYQLRTGQQDIINQYTEPEVDIQLDPHAEIMQSLLKNPLKMEIFMMYVEAERRTGDDNEDETDRLNMRQLLSILTPMFTDPEFEVTEDTYAEYIDKAAQLGLFSTPSVVQVEEEFHG